MLRVRGTTLGCGSPTRPPRALLAAATGAWATGQAVWVLGSKLVVGREVRSPRRPTPASCPSPAGGRRLLSCRSTAAAGRQRVRALLDGLVAARSLLVLAGRAAWRRLATGRTSGLATALAVAYPLGDVVVADADAPPARPGRSRSTPGAGAALVAGAGCAGRGGQRLPLPDRERVVRERRPLRRRLDGGVRPRRARGRLRRQPSRRAGPPTPERRDARRRPGWPLPCPTCRCCPRRSSSPPSSSRATGVPLPSRSASGCCSSRWCLPGSP